MATVSRLSNALITGWLNVNWRLIAARVRPHARRFALVTRAIHAMLVFLCPHRLPQLCDGYNAVHNVPGGRGATYHGNMADVGVIYLLFATRWTYSSLRR